MGEAVDQWMAAAYCQVTYGTVRLHRAILNDIEESDDDGRRIPDVGLRASCCNTRRRTMALGADGDASPSVVWSILVNQCRHSSVIQTE